MVYVSRHVSRQIIRYLRSPLTRSLPLLPPSTSRLCSLCVLLLLPPSSKISPLLPLSVLHSLALPRVLCSFVFLPTTILAFRSYPWSHCFPFFCSHTAHPLSHVTYASNLCFPLLLQPENTKPKLYVISTRTPITLITLLSCPSYPNLNFRLSK
jgi:hypothetical protein